MNAEFRFGEWRVEVAANALSMGDVRNTLEPRVMDVLRYLCRHPGAVIPAEELLQACWGTAELGDNPVHKAIAQLRRALGDSSTEPRYIETVRKRGYRAIADVVEDEAATGLWQGGSPFRGLEAFEESHAAIFFGRASATTRLRETVLRQVAGGCAMALVLGPSGSGKTSLVRAGLLPSLMNDGESDAPVALDCLLHMDCADLGGTDLFGALAAVLLDAELDGRLPFDGNDAQTLGRRLREDADAVLGTLGLGTPIRIAVFVDRLEAIFRAPATTDTDRARFIVALETLARCGVLVVLACRNDFYPDLIALPELVALKARGGHFDVDPPTGADIAQMVREPARAAGLAFERDPATGACLDDVLCDAARASPDALPLLQYCLDELYRQRGEDGSLKFEVFRQLGGIEGALGVRAEQIVATLPAAQQEALPHVLSLLVHIGEEQHAVTARRAPWSALTGSAQRELVRALVEARLFVSELAGNVPSFGVAHEALLRRWPRVVEWIERHRQALQLCSRVSAQASRWDAGGRPKDLLLPPGLQSNQARGLLDLKELTLPEPCGVFIHASLRRARLGERIRLGIVAVIVLLAVLAGALGLNARRAQLLAERHRTEAEGIMGYMLSNFVDKLRPLGRLELLDDVRQRALTYLSGEDAASSDPAMLAERAKTLQLIAEIGIARGQADEAERALGTAQRTLMQRLERAPRDKEVLKELGANAYWFGRISLDRADMAGAKTHFDRYRVLSEQLVAVDPQDVDSWIELSYAHSNQGTAAMASRDFRLAETSFNASMELKNRAIARRPADDGLKVDLANSLSWLASTKVVLGKFDEARALNQREIDVLSPLHASVPTNAMWTFRLASACTHRAELDAATGANEAASRHFRTALDLLEGVSAKDPTNRAWRRHWAITRFKYLESVRGLGTPVDDDQARLLVMVEELLEAEPAQPELAALRAFILRSTAEQMLSRGAVAEAEQRLDRSIPVLRDLYVKKQRDANTSIRLADGLVARAALAWTRSQRAAAASACEEAIAILEPLSSDSTDFNVVAPWVLAHMCAGKAQQVKAELALLDRMGYRDVRYLKYLALYRP